MSDVCCCSCQTCQIFTGYFVLANKVNSIILFNSILYIIGEPLVKCDIKKLEVFSAYVLL